MPLFSAVKLEGQKLYKKARKEKIKAFQLPVKEVEVYKIKIKSLINENIIQDEKSFFLPVLTCEIECGKGFYVRSFAHDLGLDLDIGGVLVELRRTQVGNYKVKDSKAMEDFLKD